ncbi:MAG: hypothetical protein JWO42_828 [Chloroflexi bacterium]|nr:hypothetical protein [Chloroflexota bacterium]
MAQLSDVINGPTYVLDAARVIFDDQLLAHALIAVRSLGDRYNAATEAFRLEAEPLRHRLGAQCFCNVLKIRKAAATVAHLDCVTDANAVRWDVGLSTIDIKVTMSHQLARLFAVRGKAKPEHDVVKPLLQKSEQRLAGHTGLLARFSEGLSELRLEEAVNPTCLLLLAELQAILRRLAAALLMRARRIRTALDRALLGHTTLAFEEQLNALSATQFAIRPSVSCHIARGYTYSEYSCLPPSGMSESPCRYLPHPPLCSFPRLVAALAGDNHYVESVLRP